MKKILIISSIKPSKINDGNPSGLIDYLYRFINKTYDTTYYLVKADRDYHKLGLFIPRINIDVKDFDIVITYPFYITFGLNLKKANNVKVLGPDATSLVWLRRSRLYGFSNYKKYLYKLLYLFFQNREKHLSNKGVEFLLVGKNDLNHFHNNGISSVKYLTHPIVDFKPFRYNIQETKKAPEFVISGHYSRDMFCLKALKIIQNYIEGYKLIVVGRNNRWIVDLFPKNNVVYIDFVDDYSSVCKAQRHIHLCPISYGGGTKNRVLSALNYGCMVFGTEIANENIQHPNLKKIEDLKNLDKIKYVDERYFADSINKKFKLELKNILNEA